MMDSILRAYDLGRTQWYVLYQLVTHGPTMQRDLARILQDPPRQASKQGACAGVQHWRYAPRGFVIPALAIVRVCCVLPCDR